MGQVVKISKLGNGIVQIKMEDRDSKNTFSTGLVEGISNAFKEIKNDPDAKVVILTGYDNYFCCGGTKKELFAIYNKEITFSVFKFFVEPLMCELPVISAMQGHGIGGGFVFGCYADFLILGKENIYTTNFMKYGFTPGMGGTYMVPQKLGSVVGNEMLYTAENYRGIELLERGIPQKVVPKSEVMAEAFKLARQLAEKPRISLITLKKRLTIEAKSKINQVIEDELAMHDATFHRPEVAERIEKLFNG